MYLKGGATQLFKSSVLNSDGHHAFSEEGEALVRGGNPERKVRSSDFLVSAVMTVILVKQSRAISQLRRRIISSTCFSLQIDV